jgi:WD40 repeat protein
LAIATRDGNIQVFEADSGRAVGAVMAHSVGDEPRMTGMSFHPDGRLLASCSYSQIIIWDTIHAKMKSRFSTRPGGLATCVKHFAQGTKLAAANYGDPGYGFTFFDAETGKLIAQGMVTSHESVKAWDMAFPDSEDPVIVIAAEEMLYECRYSAVIGKKPGIKVIR